MKKVMKKLMAGIIAIALVAMPVTAMAGETSHFSFTNVAPDTFDITGTKTWDDDNNRDGVRPNIIDIMLVADGVKIEEETMVGYGTDDPDVNHWQYEFDGVPRYDGDDGHEIVYTIQEKDVDGYTTTYDGYDITNYHKPETVDITVEKIWKDNNNQDDLRPSDITVTLYANGVEIDDCIMTGDPNDDTWEATFEDLYKFEDGTEIEYVVEETSIDGYVTSYEQDGYDWIITNTQVAGAMLPNAGGINTLIGIIIGSAVVAAGITYAATENRRRNKQKIRTQK